MPREFVQVRHRKPLATVCRDVGVAEIIGEEGDDVGLRRIGSVQRGQRREQQGGEEGEAVFHDVECEGGFHG